MHALIQVQAGFEASVEDMLQGLDGFWKQLEELHAGVTLSKREGQGHKDLASAQTEAEVSLPAQRKVLPVLQQTRLSGNS